MPELMRRHVNADMQLDGVYDLDCERFLAFADAFSRDEDRAIHVSAKTRQNVTAIPSEAVGHLVRHLTDSVLPFRFCVPGGNVKEQLASRPIWFAEVLTPTQGTQVLRPQR